jgi:hypothetical protein
MAADNMNTAAITLIQFSRVENTSRTDILIIIKETATIFAGKGITL